MDEGRKSVSNMDHGPAGLQPPLEFSATFLGTDLDHVTIWDRVMSVNSELESAATSVDRSPLDVRLVIDLLIEGNIDSPAFAGLRSGYLDRESLAMVVQCAVTTADVTPLTRIWLLARARDAVSVVLTSAKRRKVNLSTTAVEQILRSVT